MAATRKDAPTALGGDIFAGLFTMGVKQAGFRLLGHLEHSDYGAATARLNFPGLDVRCGKENWEARRFRRKADLFYTNPPCAPWSGWSGRAQSWKTDPRIRWGDDLVTAAIEEIEPKAFVWESVTSTWRRGNAFVLDKAHRFAEAGYATTVLLQNNMYLGAPQNRKRMLFVAHRYPLVWPSFTRPRSILDWLAKVESTPEQLEEAAITAWEKKLWKRAAQTGGSFRRAYESFPPEERKGAAQSYMNVRFDPEEPPNLVSEHRFHHAEPRKYTYPERLVLCGCPPNWKSAETRRGEIAGELLRAVLPPVGKWIATAVKNGLDQPAYRGKNLPHYLVDFLDPEHPRMERIEPREMEGHAEMLAEIEAAEEKKAKERTRRTVVLNDPEVETISETPERVVRRGRGLRKISTERGPERRTSKAFITERLAKDRFLPPNRPPKEWAERVADEVRAAFSGRTTKASDVYFVYNKLANQ